LSQANLLKIEMRRADPYIMGHKETELTSFLPKLEEMNE
jgi:hypothetical protein